MKKIITIAFAMMVTIYGYSQTDYLPLTAGSGSPLTGILTLNKTGQLLSNTTAGTDARFANIANSGGSLYWGIAGSAANSLWTTGGQAYASSFGSANNTPIQIATNDVVRYTIDGSGNNTWTGSGTFGGDVTINNGSFFKAKRADGIALNVLGYDSGTGNLSMTASDVFIVKNTGAANLFHLNANTKAATFYGSLNGTSATFSGITKTNSAFQVINTESNTIGVGSYISLENGLANAANRAAFWQLGADGDLLSFTYNGSTYSERMRITNATGAVSITGALSGTSGTFNNAGKAQLRISSTTPSAKGVGASISLGGNYRSAGDYSEFTRVSAEKTNAIDNDYSYNLAFYTTNNGGPTISSTPALVLNHDNTASFTNNVGVGTAQANCNLYVHGTIKSKEVKVEATLTVPDYVFDKSYDLKPLSEVEKYITENKHLPEIPSAKVIEKEGINVGDMQLGLLKKIEELTLYMIEQNKLIQQQNKRIEELEKKNK